MSSVSLKLLASVKIPACIAIGCGGTVVVQHYTTSSSSSWGEKAAKEKDGSGKGMKFEINQLSKQLEEKEQSLKTWEGMLAKQAADLKEQQAAVSSVSAQTKTVTTVAKPKLEQPIIDEAPFGEEGAKPGKLKASNIAQWGITKREAEVPTPDAPKRPAVFDGGGTPAVAFPPTADVVAIKEEGDIPEALQEKNRRLAELNASNEDLKRELEETKQKLAKAEAEAKKQVCRLGEECERLKEVGKDTQAKVGNIQEKLGAIQKRMTIVPEEGSFAVCRLKPKEASRLWNFAQWMFGACLDKRRGALSDDMVRNKKVNLSDVNECYSLAPTALYVCATSDPEDGQVVKKDKNMYSVRPQPRGFWFWLFCSCKKRTNEIRKLEYEEAVVKVKSEENGQDPKGKERCSVGPQPRGFLCCLFCPCKKRTNEIRKLNNIVLEGIPELFDELSPKEREIFELKNEEIGTNRWTPLLNECQNSEAKSESNSGNRHEAAPEMSPGFVSFGDTEGFFIFGFVRKINKWWNGE